MATANPASFTAAPQVAAVVDAVVKELGQTALGSWISSRRFSLGQIPDAAARHPCRASRGHGHGRVVQRQVFYLGEINDSQRAAWSKAIEVFDEGAGQSKQIALFPKDRLAPVLDCDVVSIRMKAMRLRRPRQWGACWMATLLWDQLRLDEFWLAARPKASHRAHLRSPRTSGACACAAVA